MAGARRRLLARRLVLRLLLLGPRKHRRVTSLELCSVTIAYPPPSCASPCSLPVQTVKLWDASSRACTTTWADSHTDQVWGVAFDPSGKRLASVGDDRAIVMYEAEF